MGETNSSKVREIKNTVAGMMMASALLIIGYYINEFGVSKLLFAAMFVGFSTGHYLGMALKKEGKGVERFLTGGLVVWTIGFLLIVERKLYLGSLVLCSGASIFLVHNSELVSENERIGKLVSILSKQFSAWYHWIILFIRFLWPILADYPDLWSVGVVIVGIVGILVLQAWVKQPLETED